MSKTPTVHNPTNFNPQDYEVQTYLDNKPPEPPFGVSYEAWRDVLKEHERELLHWLPDGKYYRCVHCGHHIRYVAVCLHIPTGQNVAFGQDCVCRCAFKDQQQFKLAQIQARAAAHAERVRIGIKCQAFLLDRPELAALFEKRDSELHKDNGFIHDVFNRFLQYGSLSDAQVNALFRSFKGDEDRAARKAAEALIVRGDAPEGRVRVSGTVLFVRTEQHPDWGTSIKWLVELENKAKVWGTVPSSIFTAEKGDKVEFTATFKRKDDDKSFAYASRPTKGVILEQVSASLQ